MVKWTLTVYSSTEGLAIGANICLMDANIYLSCAIGVISYVELCNRTGGYRKSMFICLGLDVN